MELLDGAVISDMSKEVMSVIFLYNFKDLRVIEIDRASMCCRQQITRK